MITISAQINVFNYIFYERYIFEMHLLYFKWINSIFFIVIIRNDTKYTTHKYLKYNPILLTDFMRFTCKGSYGGVCVFMCIQLRTVPIVGSRSDVGEASSVDAVWAVLSASSESAVTQPAGLYHGLTARTGRGCGGLWEVQLNTRHQ